MGFYGTVPLTAVAAIIHGHSLVSVNSCVEKCGITEVEDSGGHMGISQSLLTIYLILRRLSP